MISLKYKITLCFSVIVSIVFLVIIIFYQPVKVSIINNVNSFYEAINNNKNSILIIDLRDDDDYERGHIGQAINLPYNDDGEYMLTYLNKNNYQNKEIYLICYSGNRATKAFNLLFASDYKNINYLTFGYEEFIENVGSDFSPAVGECNCKAN